MKKTINMDTTNNKVTVTAVPFNPQTQNFNPTPQVPNVSAVSATPRNAAGEMINPTAQDVANFNAQFTTTRPQYNNPNPTIAVDSLNTQKINIPYSQPSNFTVPTQNSAFEGIQRMATPVSDAASSISSTMLKLIPELQGQSQELAAQKKTLGVDVMRTNLQNLSNQILQKQAELQQQDVALAQGLQNIEDQTIPMEFITGQQLSVEKRANLAKAVKTSQINMLNASALAAQGNIALANDLAQEAVDLKFAPIKEAYTTLQAQLQAIQPLLSAEEKRVAAQQSMMVNVQKQLLDIKADQQKSISGLLMQSQANGIDQQTYTKALNAYNRGASDIEIAGIIGPYGGKEYLANKDLFNSLRNQTKNAIGELTIDSGYSLDDFKKGIAGVESGGSGGYSAVGPLVTSGMYKGEKALGKYQVMPGNLPSWLKQAGLPNMTPQQFLQSPSAQEAVFENQSMTQYAKYGNWDDVAAVWFSGSPMKNNYKGDGYNSVPAYIQKVRNQMGVPTFAQQSSSPIDKLQAATAGLKLTEGQSKALAFGQRAINADKALTERLKTYDPTTIFSSVGRLARTDNARAFERDLTDFITAVLRKESGATITEDEFDRFIPLYSPQGIMTNSQDITQTNAKRQAAIDSLIAEAGMAANALKEYKVAPSILSDYYSTVTNTLNGVNTMSSTTYGYNF